jgi:hypothetical protein
VHDKFSNYLKTKSGGTDASKACWPNNRESGVEGKVEGIVEQRVEGRVEQRVEQRVEVLNTTLK